MLNPIPKGVVAGLAALAFTADAVVLPTRGHRADRYPNNAKGERITNGGSSGVAATSEVE